MSPEHTALVARLENSAFSPASPAGKVEREAAAVIRALAGEVERLKLHYKGVPHDWVAQGLYDDLAAEVAALRKDAESNYRKGLEEIKGLCRLQEWPVEEDHWESGHNNGIETCVQIIDAALADKQEEP